MKLMKRVSIALVLCAIPAMAVGQVTTTCAGCTHALSHYMGAGGFIATATEGTKKVTWLGQCGGVTRTGELVPNDDGLVSALFTRENGLACMAEKASFELGPIMDGGWFWITDDKNSAVGLLVDKEVYKALKYDAIELASAGDGVKMTAGMGAVYLKETATGRVGILPNILPKPITPLRKCGYTTGGTAASPTYSVLNTSCQLSDGYLKVWARYADPLTGATRELMDGGTVVRPGAGVLKIRVDAYGDSHFTTDPTKHGARLGHKSGIVANYRADSIREMTTQAYVGHRPTQTTLKIVDRSGGDATGFVHGVRAHGTPGPTIEIRPDENFCSSKNNISLPVEHYLNVAPEHRVHITPAIKVLPQWLRPQYRKDLWRITELKFTVVCPPGSGSASTSSDQGQDPGPDNPLPVE